MQKDFLAIKPEEQRDLLFALLWNAELSNKKIVNISYKEPYNVIAQCDNKDDFRAVRRERDSNHIKAIS